MRSAFGISTLLALVLLGAQPPSATDHAGAQEKESSFFAQRVAPLLQQSCLDCHNAAKRRGGLDLTTRDSMLKGGMEGPAVLPGNADKSLLIQLVSGPKAKMPRQGPRLTGEQITDLRKWVNDGASWPKGLKLQPSAKTPPTGDWWSFRPLKRPPLPTVKTRDWALNEIDRFILAVLEGKDLLPAPPADRVTFIRRVTFDLHGLPPTPEEIAAFVFDRSPHAYEKLIDRLLASPRYGERWGRHWLDIVHYADTHGYDKDKRRLWAWLYRDYVIRAFNQDLPYRRFIRAQLAGDILFPEGPDGIIATGFIAAGPWDFVGHVELREGTIEKEKTRTLDRDDMVANTISTFVSLTAHCARCHDHKFDPITQKDYYRLQAVFAGIERGDRVYPDRQAQQRLLALEQVYRKGAARREALRKKIQDWTTALIDVTTRAELAKVEADLAALDRLRKSVQPLVYAVVPRAPRPIHVLQRGDVEKKGEQVHPSTLAVLAKLPSEFKLAKPEHEGSRRVALANWIADPNNVLTWRSIVNRIWHYHFGRGLVDTPNDFGRMGSTPTHPELLDWLAVEFRDQGGSFKALHRKILLSATYRQSTKYNAAYARIDADNRYLWRMNRQRLDAESIRDAVLAVSGQLGTNMGGPGYELFRFKEDHSPVYDHSDLTSVTNPQTWRRTVYRFVVRSVPNPFLECLDCADPNLSTPVRNTTLTALQALAVLNNPFMVKQSEFFAERLKKISSDPKGQIEAAYRLALGRAPSAEERMALVGYLQKHGLANVCRLLFNTNEFMFID
jgi:mono/diheme cytochrome c family protein